MHDQYHHTQISRAGRLKSAARGAAGCECTAFNVPENSFMKRWRLLLGRLLLGALAFSIVPASSIAGTEYTKENLKEVIALNLEKTSSESSSAINFTEVADGIYVRYGRHEPVDANSIADIANHGFIVGEKGVAIIDPGGSVDLAMRTLEAVAKVTSLPVTHVIVSHVHADHSVGLAAYGSAQLDAAPIILGHAKLAASLHHNLEFFTQQFISTEHADNLLHVIEAELIQPVEKELVFNLGNREITVTAFSKAHSGSDITVYDKKSHVLWAGDLLFVDRTPALDGSLLGWIEALEQISQMDVRTVIPGHGRSGDYALLVKPQLDYLNLLVKYTRAAIAKGVSLNAFISQSEKVFNVYIRAQWELFDSQHAANLSRSFVELEWE